MLSHSLAAYGWKIRSSRAGWECATWPGPSGLVQLRYIVHREGACYGDISRITLDGIGLQVDLVLLIVADVDSPVWASWQPRQGFPGNVWYSREYSPCCYASDGVRVVRAACTVPLPSSLRGRCHHLHNSQAYKAGLFTAQEAVALSAAVSHGMGASVTPLLPQESGYRLGVTALEPEVGGEAALPKLLLRYAGRAPPGNGVVRRVPTDSYGSYLSEQGALTPRVAVVAHVQEWTPAHIYVGRACPKLGLPASPWANPFRSSGHVKSIPRKRLLQLTRRACVRGLVCWLSCRPCLARFWSVIVGQTRRATVRSLLSSLMS